MPNGNFQKRLAWSNAACQVATVTVTQVRVLSCVYVSIISLMSFALNNFPGSLEGEMTVLPALTSV